MSTPALDRATGRHELFNRVPFPPACSCGVEMPDGNVRENFAAHLDDVARATRAAVSAALRHPDKGRDPVAEALCSHDESVHHMERTDDFPCSACVSAADAVRAAILGEQG